MGRRLEAGKGRNRDRKDGKRKAWGEVRESPRRRK